MALKRLANGSFQIYLYDADIGGKRYMGVAPTEESARELEAAIRLGFQPPDKPRAAWTLATKGEAACRVCDEPAEHLHHLIPVAERFVYRAIPEYAGIPLCSRCHTGWHHRAVTIYADCLQPQEAVFVVEMMGREWFAASYPKRKDSAMADYYDQTRMIVARMEGERFPMVVGAVAQSTWEVIPPEDWDRIKRELAEKWLGPDWTSYDYVEVVVTIPCEQLNEMFDAREITPVTVEAATE